jgi:epoxyqueuosine reductase
VAPDPARGWISRYAWGDDYHEIVGKKLRALCTVLQKKAADSFEAKLYVDTGPVLERVYAQHAGLGWQGKNTSLLDTELGSFFFLGVLVTNLALAPDAPPADQCGACTLCLEACPTGALVAPYVMDARRCISYLTIELRDSIPEELRAPMGRHVFGCDICQDVCPYNRKARRTELAAFEPRATETRNSKLETRPQTPPSPPSPVAPATGTPATRAAGAARLGEETQSASLFHPRLGWLASLTDEEFKLVFRESAVRRAKRRGLLRNALVAMGNSGDARFRPLLERFAASPDPLLGEHAQWALAQLAVKAKG